MRLLIFALVSVILTGCGKAPEKQTSQFYAMNTFMSVTAYGENAEAALKGVKAEIQALESLFSVTDPESDIAKINRGDSGIYAVHPKTAEVVAFSLDMAKKTGGALDPTMYPVLSQWGFTTGQNRVPAADEIQRALSLTGYDRVSVKGESVCAEKGVMIDLGAVAKGFAGDEAIRILKSNGVTSALLDLGGNIQTIGNKPDGSDWKIGLRNPKGDGVIGIIAASDCAVVTSGNYERYFVSDQGDAYGHIIDPASGYPVQSDVLSVTVIGESGKVCDALSTALFVMGMEKAVDFYRENGEIDMLITTDDGVYATSGAYEAFTPEGGVPVFRIPE